MILKVDKTNPSGNKIAAGEEVGIIQTNGEEIYVMPHKSRQNNLPIGVWVKKSEVQV